MIYDVCGLWIVDCGMKDGVRGCGCVEDGEGEGSAMSASNTFQSN